MSRCPTLPCQTVTAVSMSVPGVMDSVPESTEVSIYKRPIFLAQVPVSGSQFSNTITIQATYDIITRARWLERGDPSERVEVISDREKSLYTNSTKMSDIDSPIFQAFLSDNRLRKPASESEIDFAYRAYKFIKSKYHYAIGNGEDFSASHVCTINTLNCGSASNIFVAILRASNISARQLVGRLAKSGNPGEIWAQAHVKAEFYASRIGWIPVDMAPALGKPDENDKNYFGSDDGKFIVTHHSTDLVIDTKHFGNQELAGAQSLSIWVYGKGTFAGFQQPEDWLVKSTDLLPK